MSERKGMGGHQSAGAATTTWLTPPHVLDGLGGWESFDLDPCAFGPSPIRTARHGFSLPDVDGLAASWADYGRVWLNPPYTSGEIGDWLAKLADHGEGSALIFARTETEAFQAQVFGRASGLLWLAGRLHFHYPDGTRAKANAGAPSVLVAYGQDDLDRLAASDLPGNLSPLRFARYFVIRAAVETSASWREIVVKHMREAGGPVHLSDLYRALARHGKTAKSPHWRAKVRQTLQRLGANRVGPSQWSYA